MSEQAPAPKASWHRETFAAQAGGAIDAETGAVVAPIHVASTYERDPDNAYRRGYGYGRPDNATVRQAEAVLTNLEGGAAALLVGSGMAAATTAFLALERDAAGHAHVVAPKIMYWALRQWLAEDAADHGVDATFVDATDPGAIAAAVRPGVTRMVWLETPANPMWGISDIAESARIAHDAGAVLAVDSTAATPVLTRPIEHGADLVMHSATKYLNGHSDVLAGGLVVARVDHHHARLLRVRKMLGNILGPFEAFLLLRGMRTLHVRVRQQCATAERLAGRLAFDPRVVEVLYPGLAGRPGHNVAAKQMDGGFGGMLSIRVRAGEAAAIATAARLRLWKRATSLGGVESLVEHRASVEGPGTPCPADLLRLSVGLERYEDLIDDLDQALGSRG